MSNLLVDITPFKPIIKESKENPNIFMVEGILQRANAKNQNGRIYSRQVLEREANRYIEDFIKIGNAYGELDHPESPIVSLKNASHVVKDMWWKGNDLLGRIQLLNTPSGNIVKEIIKGGHTIGISSRGTGSVQQTSEGVMMVQDDFELVCFDFVSNPSTHNAFMTPTSLQEGKTPIKEQRREKINSIIREILCSTTCECSLEI